MGEEGEALQTITYVLNGGTVRASRKVPIDEDARGESHLALESRMVELIREGCRRHCCGVCVMKYL